jgi:hypothetical protein
MEVARVQVAQVPAADVPAPMAGVTAVGGRGLVGSWRGGPRSDHLVGSIDVEPAIRRQRDNGSRDAEI